MLPAAGRVLEAGWEGLRGLEGRAAAAAASLLGADWPAKRWPIHVFTSGAIVCMLTSSVCHLLGCCSFHISQVRRPVHGLAEGVCTCMPTASAMCLSAAPPISTWVLRLAAFCICGMYST